ncbi:hypothetical protein B0J11DRAFT_59573 [Dendryphion nanum]|uniref:Peptidase C14 caspase domain-containing protein n=1 Tax=Dendryphion nanum TaxID=256645 RepID=A0A9P9DL36_9PLEO|nr:hypothetical protein B0J11DRAFT_59573 [Dendryphion nanum]
MESTCKTPIDRPVKNHLPTKHPPNEAVRPTPTIDTSNEYRRVIASDDVEATQESEKQAWFQNAINEKLDIPNGYLKVAVLIVRWHEDIDSFPVGHEKEVNELTALFRERFNYEVEETKLGKTPNPQIELNYAIMQHIFKHDGRNNLLIVYYTGHGAVYKPHDQHLELSANGHTNVNDSNPSVAFWGEAEEPLLRNSVKSDILAILDCCYASNALKGPTKPDNVYELMGASPRNSSTPGPGEKSMTHALIKALESMLDSNDNNYTTIRLQSIMNRNRKMSIQIGDQLHRHHRHIQLQPVKKPIEGSEGDQRFSSMIPEQAWFKLRFSLKDAHLTKAQVEKFARALPAVCSEAELPIRRIDWTMMETHSSPPSRTTKFANVAHTVLCVQKISKSRDKSNSPSSSQASPILKRKRSSTGSTVARRQSSSLQFEPRELGPPSPLQNSDVEDSGNHGDEE